MGELGRSWVRLGVWVVVLPMGRNVEIRNGRGRSKRFKDEAGNSPRNSQKAMWYLRTTVRYGEYVDLSVLRLASCILGSEAYLECVFCVFSIFTLSREEEHLGGFL